MILKEITIKVARELIDEGNTEFTSHEAYERALQLDPNVKKYSLFSTLHALTKGSHHPAFKEEEKFLEKVDRARYCLAPPPPPPTPKRLPRVFRRRSKE